MRTHAQQKAALTRAMKTGDRAKIEAECKRAARAGTSRRVARRLEPLADRTQRRVSGVPRTRTAGVVMLTKVKRERTPGTGRAVYRFPDDHGFGEYCGKVLRLARGGWRAARLGGGRWPEAGADVRWFPTMTAAVDWLAEVGPVREDERR